jgi:murein DD-endopeptidase MepM/ murein hydrolase activator NlpD
MPNTYRQIRTSYQRVMRTDMTAREVWAATVQVFRQLKEDIYVIAPYREAPAATTGTADETSGMGGIDIPLAYANRRCSAAPLITTVPPALPLREGHLTSPFGYRIHPITKEEGVHSGMDIGAPLGSPIFAAFYGTVREVGEGEVLGKYIILDHAGGLQTVYGHCSEILAEEGMVLRPGETIALVGSTGLSTGPHLHFELRLGGLRCNPAPLLGNAFPAKET